jgi:pimeloyl-ACP methyl ester carboxylesterase
MPLTERRLRLGGLSTAVLEGGKGPDLVFLHGPGGNATHWNGVVRGLTERYHVVVPDLPGHGASESMGVHLDVASVLGWLGDLIEQTSRAAPVLVGQHLGGAIAARFAITSGDRIQRLVLIDSFGLSAFQPTPEFGKALMTFSGDPTPKHHDELWQYCARDASSLRKNMGELWKPFEAYNIERARSESQQVAVQELMGAFGMSEIPADELARIRVPVTLVWGRHDLATPLAVAEAASERFGWPLEVVEDANDDPPVERPDAIQRVLRSMLEGAAA